MQVALKLKRPQRSALPRGGAGLSIGCFAGAGYGLFVGIGHLRPIGRRMTIVTPSISAAPFAHEGALTGAFCGVLAGAGFASSVSLHLGYHWEIFTNSHSTWASTHLRNTAYAMVFKIRHLLRLPQAPCAV